METLRVLFQNHRLSGRVHGGDLVQLFETRKHLQRMGIEAEVSSEPAADLSNYDLVHIFNALESERSYAFAKNCLAQRTPYVVSPIYWDPSRFLIEGSSFTTVNSIDRLVARVLFQEFSIEKLSAAKHWFGGGGAERIPSLDRARSVILLNASRVLPNSIAEGEILQARFPLPSERLFVVYNAVDPSFAVGDPEAFRDSFAIDGDFVLSCARLEPRKNTTRLVEASVAEEIPLVILGLAPLAKDTITDKLFRARSLKRAAARSVVVLPSQRYGSPLHTGAYAAAHAHALPSWFETPGLASLEAAAAGCQVVTTIEGSAVEYFKTLAEYCDPGSVQSIREALRNAWSRAGRAKDLKEHVLSRFSWEEAAKSTLAAYRGAMSGA